MKEQTYLIKTKEVRSDAAKAVLAITGEPLCEVVIRRHKKRRSGDANSFYWACVVEPLANFIGYTKDEMHEELLGIYFGWETREFKGHKREYPRRTTTTPDTLETMEFKGLIETGQRIAAELGVRLPDESEENQ